MQLFNTLTRRKEPFEPLEPPLVRIYSCGPTVYAEPHVGNLTSFLFADLLSRHLAWKGYSVRHVMNMTDVDDKTIHAAGGRRDEMLRQTRHFEQVVLDQMDRLSIRRPSICRATEHIDEMVALVQRLLRRGHAYRHGDGGLYFSIASWPQYGRLSGVPDRELKPNASGRRRASTPDGGDFVLWKPWTPADGDVFWEPAFRVGDRDVVIRGRPGWHIECSAMSRAFLGESFDIHTGGADLCFPHHENEIAQSDAALGRRAVARWMHRALVTTAGEKMAKSVGNVVRLSDFPRLGIAPAAFRLLVLSGHYRTPLDLTDNSLHGAQANLKRIREFLRRLREYGGSVAPTRPGEAAPSIQERVKGYAAAMDDDLDTPVAIREILTLVNDLHREMDAGTLTAAGARAASEFFRSIDQVWAFGEDEGATLTAEERAAIEGLVEQRNLARREKRWADADRIRAELTGLRVVLEDQGDGTRWHRE